MTYRIVVTGGGTAGSVTPLIAIVQQIRRQRTDVEFLFLGSANGPERVLAKAADIPFESIAGGKLRRYWSLANIKDIHYIIRGYTQAAKILRRWKPRVVITAGSFISVPVIWAAKRQAIRTLVHQQDVRPGLANRLMAPAASVITVAFKSSASAFPAHKVFWTGNPVRPEVLAGSAAQGRKIFHLSESAPVLLVIGGGTGSAAVNTLVGTMAFRLVRQWSILHVTGPERDFVELHDPHYQRFPFLTWQLPHALAAADVVISRAGLGAVSELAALGKATVFIPMPNSHQEENTAVVAKASAAIVLHQNSGHLEQEIESALEQLYQKPEERLRLGNNLRQFYNPEALPQLVDHVFHLLGL